MEHDIQYKSSEQIPTSIQRRFIALAGMLEIADREFQAIQDEDAKLRKAVSASLQDDLTKTTISKPSDSYIDTEKQGKNVLPVIGSQSVLAWNPQKVRALVASGKYDEAVLLYTKMLDAHPGSYTLYIGRSRAKFLAGDRSGAISDLDHAENLNPNDESIASLRAQIEEGIVFAPKMLTDAWQLSSAGNEALSKGDGEDAFRLYSQAQELGFHSIFSTFNKAMACALIKDSDGATYFMDQFQPITDSPTEINYLALRTIIAVIARSGYPSCFKSLKSKLSQLTGFEIGQSPLRHLESGFYARDIRPAQQIIDVFEHLKK